ncbi:NB-ARC domain-containing protein [Nonomuraea sp. NBC_01738]|uniref:AfsR/SARP family transcriptional regulator n=1 Tax=Nonomuraea sp. NBC_01738 TaxID=2976003 RepID=UPI002E105FC4|nr:NB-ARC domain-containing protein [Nonomuraea sp. NBC_01738]
MPALEIRLLGPVELMIDGDPVHLAERPAVVLAVLALESGRLVGMNQLIDEIWGNDPPATARAQIPIHISTLRKTFGPAKAIETVGSSYRLRASAVQLDADRVEQLVEQAREARDAGLYQQAFELWRGPALAGLGGQRLEVAAQRLEDLRLTILEEWAPLESALVERGQMISRLSGAVSEHPLREATRARLMELHWQVGRTAEALAVYREGRKVLVDELGLGPGQRLNDLHERILRGESPAPEPVRPAPSRRPCQLPPTIAAFAGRKVEQGALDALLDSVSGYLPLVVISGIAGVGKTTLAVRWAHRAAEHFPDGQLFADLRGHDQHAAPATAHEVLDRFLRALGIPCEHIPAGNEERADLFRSTLQDRKVLILLDNAASSLQVRPLLPGASGCCVIVTARPRLEGLVTAHGAASLLVEAFDVEDSADLLTQVLGAERIAKESAEAERLAQLCEGLPLALRIAAARLATRPTYSLSDLVTRLGDEHGRLDQLTGEGVCVRDSIRLSYQDLPAQVACAFRRLALVDAPNGYAPWLLAALLGDANLTDAERLLEDLVDAQLLQPLGADETGQPRYRYHDLIRICALEQALAQEPPDERDTVQARAFSALLGLAEQATNSFRGVAWDSIHGFAPRWLPDGSEQLLAEPLDWLEAERLTLTAAVRQTATAGWAEHCWDLAVTSTILHLKRGYRDDRRIANEIALELCRHVGDLRGEAAVLLSQSDYQMNCGEIADGVRSAKLAARLFEQVGDGRGQALALVDIGIAERLLGEWDRSVATLERAVTIFQDCHDDFGTAHAMSHLGLIHLRREEPSKAERAAERGLSALPPGARDLELMLFRLLAESYLCQARHTEALRLFDTVLHEVRARGDHFMVALTLLGVGQARLARQDIQDGMSALWEARDLARNLGHRTLEGRVLLALGGQSGRADLLRAAAVLFEATGADAWHVTAIATLREQHPG